MRGQSGCYAQGRVWRIRVLTGTQHVQLVYEHNTRSAAQQNAVHCFKQRMMTKNKVK
jgi:hypothetical protein